MEWLDQQSPLSLIYIVFGSFTILTKQFYELALGLELPNRPSLWVVREDIGDDCGTKNNVHMERIY